MNCQLVLIEQSLLPITVVTILLSIYRYLLGAQNAMHNVSEVMPMIGARFYSTIEALQLHYDTLEAQLAKVRMFLLSIYSGMVGLNVFV